MQRLIVGRCALVRVDALEDVAVSATLTCILELSSVGTEVLTASERSLLAAHVSLLLLAYDLLIVFEQLGRLLLAS